MMNVMITDVRGEIRHYRPGSHIARGFERRLFVRPAGVVVEGNAGEIMLRVKQIGTNRRRDEMGNELHKHQRHPSAEPQQRASDDDVDDQSNQAINMAAWIIDEWVKAHSIQKHEHVTEQYSERMPNEEIAA